MTADKAARLVGYGRVCALILFGPQAGVPQLDWIGYSRSDVRKRHATLRALARTAERKPVEVTK